MRVELHWKSSHAKLFRTQFNLVTEVSVSTLAMMSVVQWGQMESQQRLGDFLGDSVAEHKKHKSMRVGCHFCSEIVH